MGIGLAEAGDELDNFYGGVSWFLNCDSTCLIIIVIEEFGIGGVLNVDGFYRQESGYKVTGGGVMVWVRRMNRPLLEYVTIGAVLGWNWDVGSFFPKKMTFEWKMTFSG